MIILGNLKFYPLKSSINDTADLINVDVVSMLPASYIFGALGFSQVLHSFLSGQLPLLGMRDDWVERIALENDSELLLGLFRPSADLEDIRVVDPKLDDLSMNILPVPGFTSRYA